MAKRSSVDQLPQTVRHELERKLADNGFSDYTALAEWLNEQGYEISRSAVHRYGAKIQKRFASIKASTEAARLIAEGASDEGDTRSEAVIALLQTEVFDALIAIGELSNTELDEVAKLELMGKVSKNVSPLMTASTRLKQFQSKLKADMDKTFEKLEAQSKQGTLDEATLKRIRTEVYGLIG
ncbi:DUF3486 family protein [Moraxella catarrhalis]|uniref:DUF3486 family protein n=1 Tax=Moraxella catarrhalis TaxID=480 RepID=UPI0007E2F3EB|nr:DUF3486 family protein [Moraxella catarrhalis]OAV23655.1 Phage terminase, small subunit [Moraxella catarrhalis]RKM24056.1 DUF3486 family protein [Moraxella catarrhalis]